MRWAVVVPSNRPERLAEFEEAWGLLFDKHRVRLFVVRDEPPWKGIPDWVPRRSDMIRSWGFVQAFHTQAEFVLSLDDDVAPIPGVDVFAEYEAVFDAGVAASDYLDVGALTSYGQPMRGYPYRFRGRSEVAVQYGGWDGVLDYDAAAQLVDPQPPHWFHPVVVAVPAGAAVTGCAMNMAFRRAHTQAMWQLPLLEGRFNRFGDIWAGLFAKRHFDASGLAVVVNGKAKVQHDRASDPVANLEREASGVRLNEHLWDALEPDEWREVTTSAARYFKESDPEYAAWFTYCRDQWFDAVR